MNEREETGIESSSERLPPKPTRESATGSPTAKRALRQRREPAGADIPEHLGLDRQEAAEPHATRSRPHVPQADRDGELQRHLSSPRGVPVPPANASGRDNLTPEEQNETIDEESMYDRRPERDKDRPPSERR